MKNSNKDDKNIHFTFNQKIVEALIFSSAEPISYSELQKTITDNKLLDEILVALEKKYISSGVNLCTINNSYAFRTSLEVSEHLNIERIVPKPLSRAGTETLAIIAYHQPMPQSRLVELLGQRAYDHIRELAQAGLIGRRRDGNTRRLTTTRRFSEMFGCPHTDRKKVKAWFRDMVVSSGMLDGMESKLALRDETDSAGGTQTILELGEDE